MIDTCVAPTINLHTQTLMHVCTKNNSAKTSPIADVHGYDFLFLMWTIMYSCIAHSPFIVIFVHMRVYCAYHIYMLYSRCNFGSPYIKIMTCTVHLWILHSEEYMLSYLCRTYNDESVPINDVILLWSYRKDIGLSTIHELRNRQHERAA